MGSAAATITLSDAGRRELESLARRRKTAWGRRTGPRVVPAAAEGRGERLTTVHVEAGADTVGKRRRTLPSAILTGFPTSRARAYRARPVATRRSRRLLPARWKRWRPTVPAGACSRWPAPVDRRRRRSTISGRPSSARRREEPNPDPRSLPSASSDAAGSDRTAHPRLHAPRNHSPSVVPDVATGRVIGQRLTRRPLKLCRNAPPNDARETVRPSNPKTPPGGRNGPRNADGNDPRPARTVERGRGLDRRPFSPRQNRICRAARFASVRRAGKIR